MKLTKILITLGFLLALISCKQELPYPLDEIQQGVVVDISKTPGTDELLTAEINEDNNISVTLNIPWQQGDYSTLKEAELMCVYYPAKGAAKNVVYKRGITSFPAVIAIDMNELCGLLGIPALNDGDRMDFVPNVVLKNGLTILGWNPVTRTYNNTAFTSWQVDFGNGSRAYSYRARYAAPLLFDPNDYQGPVICIEGGWVYDPENGDPQVKVSIINELPPDEYIPAGAAPEDIYGMEVDGIWDFGCKMKMWVWVNGRILTLIIPEQEIHSNWCFSTYGCYPMRFMPIPGSFDIDTVNKIILFTVDTRWGPWTFGEVDYELHFQTEEEE